MGRPRYRLADLLFYWLCGSLILAGLANSFRHEWEPGAFDHLEWSEPECLIDDGASAL